MPYLTKLIGAISLCAVAFSAVFRPPAEQRYAQTSVSGAVLPGGKFLQPYGSQVESGPGTCGIAVSPKGTIATANAGPERFSVTILERVKSSWTVGQFWARTPNFSLPELADPNWKGVGCGIAFENDRAVWISEGESGKIRLLNTHSGNHEKIVDLNQPGFTNSVTGDLASDPSHHVLFALDERNWRLSAIDTKKGQLLSSATLGAATYNVALSENGSLAYVSGADGALGIIDVHQPTSLSAVSWLKNPPTSRIGHGGVLSVGDRVFVSDEADDSVITYSATEKKVIATTPLRIPGLESLRGIRPAGMAFDPLTKWLLVAETGLNAVGIIDIEKNRVIGHIPTGLSPLRIAISADRVFVTNSQGRGTGPNLRHPFAEFGLTPALHHGSISTFIMPAEAALAKLTGVVYADNGLASAQPVPAAPLPDAIRHVVLIQKGDRSFDEVFGDIRWGNNPLSQRVQALPQLARFGMRGQAEGGKVKFSIKDVAITPNQHSIAERWSLSDNFYATGPDVDDAQLTAQLREQGVQIFDEDGLPDRKRADRFIEQMSKGSKPRGFPGLIIVRLPGDRSSLAGDNLDHPYQASWVADNDYATGRILEFLSHTPEWREMAVFIYERGSDSGLDHIDSHRVGLVAAGPWIRRNYISHTNSDSAGVLKTALQLLKSPPITLRDATAREFTDLFTTDPDFTPFEALLPDRRILEIPPRDR